MPDSRRQRFEDKTVLVTGASSGLGEQTALAFCGEGANVFALGRNHEALQKLAESTAGLSGKLLAHTADLGTASACKAAVSACVDAFGGLDVLVNVAGRHRVKHTKDVSEAQWHEDLAINLSAPFFLSQAALPHLLERNGNMVNVASIAGLQGQPYSSAYCAAKHGLLGLTRALALEYIHSGLRVNAICPGGMDTPQVSGMQFPEDIDFNLMMRTAGLRGMMQADSVAEVILFLASAEAAVIHGAVIPVDMGKTVG